MNRVDEGIGLAEAGFSARASMRTTVGYFLLFVSSTVFMKLAVSPLASGGIAADGVSGVFLLTGALVGLVLGAAAVLRRRNLARVTTALVGAVALAAGLVLYGLAPVDGAANPMAVVAAGLVGAGDTLLLLAWGRAFMRHTPKESLFCVALAYPVGSAVATLVVGLAPLAAALVCAVVCGLASAGLALCENPGPSQAPAAHGPLAAQEPGTLRDVLSFLWKPVLAALLCAFITGAANTAGAGMGLASAIYVLSGSVLIGLALVAAVCLPTRPFNLRQFYQVFIPLAAIVILCIPFLDFDALPGGAHLAYALNGCGFSLLDIATVSALATCAYVLRIPSDAVFGLERLLGALVMFAGAQLQPAFSETGMRTVCALAIAVFLGAVVVSLVRAAAPYSAAPAARPRAEGAGAGERGQGTPATACASDGRVAPADQTQGAAPTSPALDDAACCQALAQSGGLSPRETQVLGYLIRGRGSTFISQELCISVQTVKTHTKHIYEKLDVHSREDLLTLVEQTRAGERG